MKLILVLVVWKQNQVDRKKLANESKVFFIFGTALVFPFFITSLPALIYSKLFLLFCV